MCLLWLLRGVVSASICAACAWSSGRCHAGAWSGECLCAKIGECVVLARTICVRCTYGVFGREITRYMVICRA
jgi:hypothetical protein